MAFGSVNQVLATAKRLSSFATETQNSLITLWGQGQLSEFEVTRIARRNQRIWEISDDMALHAIEMVIDDLNVTQTSLENVIKSARDKVKVIADFRRLIDIVADVVTLSAALVAGKPDSILSALEEVRKDLI